MSTTTDSYAIPFDTLRPMSRRMILTRTPSLAPTIAPLGSDRLIAVCYTGEGSIRVTGKASGREYAFEFGQTREVPLADARHLVTEENFAFTGGR
ncbi:MAG: hypothetical protein IPP20_21325 [Gemmatimonadetes bacterium]|nr:hypothetical protein [Gemmatimonadota bacterium]